MTPIVRVRECDLCGEVGGVMDTVCPRCKRHGSLRDRFQCSRCKRLLEEKTCWNCADAESFRAGPAGSDILHAVTAGGLASEQVPALETMPDVADPLGVPPWVAAAVGGAVFGTGVGVAGAWFLSVDLLLGGGIGLVCGVLLGGTLGGGGSAAKRR
jgi:hypothetical protein